MNEPPPVFREEHTHAFHDARTTKARGRPILAWVVTMGAGGLFLGFVGAADSYQYSLLLRLCFWLGLCSVAGLIAITIEGAMTLFGLRSSNPIVWWAALTSTLAIAMVPVIFLVNSTGSYSPIADLPVFTLNSFAISGALVALRLIVGTMLSRSDTATDTQVTVEEKQSAQKPAILKRLNPSLMAGQLLALKSEGHYLRVYTDRGSELILMRLKDAIPETGPIEGMQVHRSWWLARRNGMERRSIDGRIELKIDDETWAPISRTYRSQWKAEDW